MLRSDFLKRFPRASEDTLRWNCPEDPPPAKSAFETNSKAEPAVTSKKKLSRQHVARTRNLGTLTEAAYWGHLRSALRRSFRWWKPALAALHAARTPRKGPRGQKWAYLCAGCGQMFLRKNVQIDHKLPVGTLLSLRDLPAFVERLTPEDPKAFAILCVQCHASKTESERKTKMPAKG